MVQRIILLKLCEGVSRDEVARVCHDRLHGLPQPVSFSVGLPADEASERSWDVSIVLRVASLEALTSALQSEPLRALFGEELAERCVVIKAWSFAELA